MVFLFNEDIVFVAHAKINGAILLLGEIISDFDEISV
jgi:hypothetical protein